MLWCVFNARFIGYTLDVKKTVTHPQMKPILYKTIERDMMKSGYLVPSHHTRVVKNGIQKTRKSVKKI